MYNLINGRRTSTPNLPELRPSYVQARSACYDCCQLLLVYIAFVTCKARSIRVQRPVVSFCLLCNCSGASETTPATSISIHR
jgi:hypothetical protein